MTFETLQLKQDLLKGIEQLGFTEPTNIQQQAIPPILDGHDLIGISKTGSGKTAAFGIPLLELVDAQDGLQVLILAPTRELAVQIGKEINKIGAFLPINTATVYGGVGFEEQVRAIKKSHIIVGTPGRVLDHLKQGTLVVDTLGCFVLDEADKMVDMGFIDDVNKILEFCPDNRQILLFGATISHEIDALTKRYMHDPVTIEAQGFVTEEYLKQFYYDVRPSDKFSLLLHLLKKDRIQRAIVFCSKRTTVDMVGENLVRQGIPALVLHGKLPQNKRQRIVDRFHTESGIVLVASAVAARGLDIKDVNQVFNYDLPDDPEEYIHRVGRTARAGSSGVAYSLVSSHDHESLRSILRRYPITIVKCDEEQFNRVGFKVTHQRPRVHNRSRRVHVPKAR